MKRKRVVSEEHHHDHEEYHRDHEQKQEKRDHEQKLAELIEREHAHSNFLAFYTLLQDMKRRFLASDELIIAKDQATALKLSNERFFVPFAEQVISQFGSQKLRIPDGCCSHKINKKNAKINKTNTKTNTKITDPYDDVFVDMIFEINRSLLFCDLSWFLDALLPLFIVNEPFQHAVLRLRDVYTASWEEKYWHIFFEPKTLKCYPFLWNPTNGEYFWFRYLTILNIRKFTDVKLCALYNDPFINETSVGVSIWKRLLFYEDDDEFHERTFQILLSRYDIDLTVIINDLPLYNWIAEKTAFSAKARAMVIVAYKSKRVTLTNILALLFHDVLIKPIQMIIVSYLYVP